MAMMWYNYLQGDLFERFPNDNLLTPSYVLRDTQSNCTHCSAAQWNSMRCDWWVQWRPHTANMICIFVTVHRLVSSHHSFGEQPLLLSSSFLGRGWFSLKTKTTLHWAEAGCWLSWQHKAAGTSGVWKNKKKVLAKVKSKEQFIYTTLVHYPLSLPGFRYLL